MIRASLFRSLNILRTNGHIYYITFVSMYGICKVLKIYSISVNLSNVNEVQLTKCPVAYCNQANVNKEASFTFTDREPTCPVCTKC